MKNNNCFVNSLAVQLEITARIFYDIAKNLFKDDVNNKITFEEYVILDSIVCYPHINACTLAKTIVREKAYVEKHIQKLIRKKILKEVKDNTNDIQVRYYELTKFGNKLYQENIPKDDKMIAIMVKFISANELASFTKTLLKIRNILISLGYVTC